MSKARLSENHTEGLKTIFMVAYFYGLPFLRYVGTAVCLERENFRKEVSAHSLPSLARVYLHFYGPTIFMVAQFLTNNHSFSIISFTCEDVRS